MKKVAKAFLLFVLAFLLLSTLAVLVMRFFHPLTSAFMVERYCKGLVGAGDPVTIEYRWVDLKNISP